LIAVTSATFRTWPCLGYTTSYQYW